MSDVALTDLDAAIAGTETIVTGITAGQWGAPTPCTGLDVRTLVNHLVAGDLIFAVRVTGAPLPDSDSDYLGDDPLGALRRDGAVPRRRPRPARGAPVAVGRRVDPVRARGRRPRQRAGDQ